MEILAKLFGNVAKVKLMRLFLFNPESAYSTKEIAVRTKLSRAELKRELGALITFGIVRSREIVRDDTAKKDEKGKENTPRRNKIRGGTIKRSKKRKIKKSKTVVFSLNSKFAYLAALKNLLITASLRADESLVKKFAKSGKLKLLIASGVFLHEWDTRVDLLIVGDELSMTNLGKTISLIEAEIGKELSYSAFETEDFEYRLGIHDRLIRDILDSPHTILVDKLGLMSR